MFLKMKITSRKKEKVKQNNVQKRKKNDVIKT